MILLVQYGYVVKQIYQSVDNLSTELNRYLFKIFKEELLVLLSQYPSFEREQYTVFDDLQVLQVVVVDVDSYHDLDKQVDIGFR